MSFITGLALSRRPVTILSILLVFALGIYSYNNIERELFPAIEFPNIFITAYYGNSDPETVMREVTVPIEDAISGMTGLQQLQSTSTESQSTIIATFNFDVDMNEAKRDIESAINGTSLPDDALTFVDRISSDTFPVMQFTVSGDSDTPALQRIVNDVINPHLRQVDGVSSVQTLSEIQEQVVVFVDAGKLQELGLSMFSLSDAISSNNASLPAGSISTQGTSYPVRTANRLGSVQDLRELVVGFEQTGEPSTQPQPFSGKRAITLADIADVELTTPNQQRISRANGKPDISIIIIKEPDANTVEVTDAVLAAMDEIRTSGALPSHVEILEISNDGPYVREALGNLLREGTLGFLFAVAVVFIFLLNIRPSLMRGSALALRPTIIMAISIPLSVITGVLLMSFTDITLNFMSLSGLAIAVGRVVDDSIVVLENMYRHIEFGEERVSAALSATREVSAAIISSTLTTVAVFVPLAFIPGIVGEFFSPFAISVSLALIASTAVAITAVPVLGAILLQRGDFSDTAPDSSPVNRDTTIQRIYTPVLIWALRHKFATIAIAIAVTGASLGLLAVIPITFFPTTTPEYMTIDIELPVGTSVERTYQEVLAVEEVLAEFTEQGQIEIYRSVLGSTADEFAASGSGGLHIAGIFVRLSEDVPRDIADIVRRAIPDRGEDVSIIVQGISGGPPTEGLEINITGSDFSQIAETSRLLEERLAAIDGIINLKSNISEGKDEVVIRVNPAKAGEYSLSASAVGAQVSQFIVGREVSEMEIQGETVDVALRGKREDVDDINKLKTLKIDGPFGQVKLGTIAHIGIEKAPLSISRFDNDRSANITGTLVAEDTQAIGALVNQAIESLDVPGGVEIKVGGIFEQVAEGFQDVFLAMAIGIVLVYLVMVATLGSLRTPFVIVLSLPLAIVGAFLALLVTGRTLSLSALMGFLLLIGIVVTNAIVLLTFVEQLRARGYGVYEALIEGGRVRLRPILMTAFTTTFALIPLAASSYEGGIIGAELATVVIGGLISSTFLTLVVVPVLYMTFTVSIPGLFSRIGNLIRRSPSAEVASSE